MELFTDLKGFQYLLTSLIDLDVIIANIGYKQYFAKIKHVKHLYNNVLYAKEIKIETVEISKSTYETLTNSKK